MCQPDTLEGVKMGLSKNILHFGLYILYLGAVKERRNIYSSKDALPNVSGKRQDDHLDDYDDDNDADNVADYDDDDDNDDEDNDDDDDDDNDADDEPNVSGKRQDDHLAPRLALSNRMDNSTLVGRIFTINNVCLSKYS